MTLEKITDLYCQDEEVNDVGKDNKPLLLR